MHSLKTRIVAIALGGVIPTLFLAGCDWKPNAPSTSGSFKPVQAISVDKDAQELALVTAMETARANYAYRLQVLMGYYHKVGNLDKYKWAQDESENLAKAKTFQWENVPEVTAPAGETLTNADERLLVEYTVIARNGYIDSVNKVILYYKNTRQDFKGKVIENMRDRLDPINLYPYFPEAMLPPRDLKPVDVIPEAEDMYTKAEKLFWDGKGLLHIFVTTSYEKERQAAVLFQKLIHDYPRSIRIAMSAYYLAEINKEYFKQNTLAVFWYERAWTWDPNLPEPARFQAATVYDVHLHNYTKAVECYRLSLKYDPTRPGNRWLCEKRVKELTGLQ